MTIVVQSPAMTEDQRLGFLQRFDRVNPGTLVGLAVLGGIFGEGIDLVGERLVGAVIVGVGLPPPGLERELIRAHFQRTGGNGFDVAYTYPGINRVLQAAGRVIRTENDRGIVVLIDRRYGRFDYRALLPAHWVARPLSGTRDLATRMAAFWANRQPVETQPGRSGTHFEFRGTQRATLV